VPCTPAAAPAPLTAGSLRNEPHIQSVCDDLKGPHHRFTGIQYLSFHIKLRQSTRTLRSPETPLLTIPFTRTELAMRAFQSSAPSVWNSLPSLVTRHSSDDLQISAEKLLFRLVFDYSVHVWPRHIPASAPKFIIIDVDCSACTWSKTRPTFIVGGELIIRPFPLCACQHSHYLAILELTATPDEIQSNNCYVTWYKVHFAMYVRLVTGRSTFLANF